MGGAGGERGQIPRRRSGARGSRPWGLCDLSVGAKTHLSSPESDLESLSFDNIAGTHFSELTVVKSEMGREEGGSKKEREAERKRCAVSRRARWLGGGQRESVAPRCKHSVCTHGVNTNIEIETGAVSTPRERSARGISEILSRRQGGR